MRIILSVSLKIKITNIGSLDKTSQSCLFEMNAKDINLYISSIWGVVHEEFFHKLILLCDVPIKYNGYRKDNIKDVQLKK